MTIRKMFFLFAAFTLPFELAAQEVLLYDNDFESPNLIPSPNCGPDLDASDVNVLWSGTGQGTGGGTFIMTNTVETILINGPDSLYNDSTGTGGNYCIAMLSTLQDDKAALTFDSQNLPFANISFDLSAINLAACGGPFVLDTPVLNIKIYDSPTGAFDFGAPGILLDETDVTGITPASDAFTFNWAPRIASLDIAGTTNGNITVVFDLLQSGYAAIDNLHIVSSVTSVKTLGEKLLWIYPNPASDRVFVNGAADAQIVYVRDATGKLLLKTRPDNSGAISLEHLVNGIYLIEVRELNRRVAHATLAVQK